MTEQSTGFTVVLSRVNLYFAVCESAIILGGKRVDGQVLDDLGWWVRSIALEFVVPIDLADRFERELRELYSEFINITIKRKAALST